MSQCPFLSTAQGEEPCFEDCALFNWGENSDICPFKTLLPKELIKKRDLFEYEFYQETEDEDEDEEEQEII